MATRGTTQVGYADVEQSCGQAPLIAITRGQKLEAAHANM